jgi:hypothetical protein
MLNKQHLLFHLSKLMQGMRKTNLDLAQVSILKMALQPSLQAGCLLFHLGVQKLTKRLL